jgi:NAD+ synthase (glutamine-hydrolysing)
MNPKLVKVGAASVNQTPLDWKKNFENIVGAIQAARAANIKILCLPEMCITGYGCEDQFHSLYVYDNAIKAIFEIVKHTDGMVVAIGLPILYNGASFNAACLMVDGQIGGFVCKQFLAGDGIHYEPRWFKPWPKGQVGELSLKGQRYPIGDLFFKVYDIRIGFEICEDAWVPNRPGIELARRGVDIILNPSASHFAFGKQVDRRRIVTDSSRAFKCAYVYANLLGNESGRCIYSGDTIISSCGKEVANGQVFSYKDFTLSSAVIDLSANSTNRTRTASLNPDMGKPHFVRCRESLLVTDTTIAPTEAQVFTPMSKEEEFGKAVSLGLFDYMRKTRSNGFVVSLSGGADSAAVSALVWLMCRDLVDELGVQVTDKLDYLNLKLEKPYHKSLVNQLLTCVYQSTKNSSDTTYNAAEKVATFLGAQFYKFDVDEVVESYKRIVSDAIGRPLTWQQDDLTLQNIQARARGPSAWMLANINGAILLATSNRSEAAVGYATMDGDTCGGISPIAGIDKHFLRQWLKYMEKYILALELVNNQQPTAELRPSENNQTDEGDLMPYSILNDIEELAIRDKKSPVEIFRILVTRGNVTSQQYGEWIEKFFKLWARNQWKRERYAPSFHLDDENLDPKTWCRFPILSGQFRTELNEMWQYINKGK